MLQKRKLKKKILDILFGTDFCWGIASKILVYLIDIPNCYEKPFLLLFSPTSRLYFNVFQLAFQMYCEIKSTIKIVAIDLNLTKGRLQTTRKSKHLEF